MKKWLLIFIGLILGNFNLAALDTAIVCKINYSEAYTGVLDTTYDVAIVGTYYVFHETIWGSTSSHPGQKYDLMISLSKEYEKFIYEQLPNNNNILNGYRCYVDNKDTIFYKYHDRDWGRQIFILPNENIYDSAYHEGGSTWFESNKINIAENNYNLISHHLDRQPENNRAYYHVIKSLRPLDFKCYRHIGGLSGIADFYNYLKDVEYVGDISKVEHYTTVEGDTLVYHIKYSTPYNSNMGSSADSYILSVVDLQSDEDGLYEDNTSELSIFPNPTSSKIFFDCGDIVISKIEVMNLEGKVVTVIDNPTDVLELSTLSKGTYFLRFHSNKGLYHRKIIINN